MELQNTHAESREVLSIDGFTVVLRYAAKPDPGVLSSIQSTLFSHTFSLKKSPKICNFTEKVR